MGLSVYKSSAGSGKTHTLVKDYIKIALINPENKFRRILAITFTNKAAGEMKERILESLKNFSSGNTSDNLAKQLKRELIITDNDLKDKSKILLENILHNFDDFNISTIDSFVHKIVKTFSKDVGLPYDFDVVLDIEDVIPEIIESIYDRLSGDEQDYFTKFMVNFVNSLSDDEKGYDPQYYLVEFIKKHTDEDSFNEVRKIETLTLDKFLDIIKGISQRLNILKKKINNASLKAKSLLEEKGLTEKHFYYGSGNIASYVTKFTLNIDEKELFPKKRVLQSVNEDKWYSGKIDGDEKNKIDSIKDDILNCFEIISETAEEYYFLKKIYGKLYKVALLKELRDFFDDYISTTGKVHISEFNKRISEAINGQPVPFIYERLGVKFEHFLIDEFQDTSVVQWYNMFPLIENSYSSSNDSGSSNFNMLVGDPKQAIYRFRGGEVELFTSLPKLYGDIYIKDKEIRENLLKQIIDFENLDVNYRSYKSIVEFNNAFFDFIRKEKKGLISNIYDNHKQKVFENKDFGGYVSIELIPSEDKDEYESKRLVSIGNYITELRGKGFEYKDICILTRDSKHGTQIADYLLTEMQIPVISSESLLISSSAEVRSVVSFLKSLINPDSVEVKAELIRNLLLVKGNSNKYDEKLRDLGIHKSNVKSILKDFGIDVNFDLLMQKTIYEISEIIFDQIKRDNNQNIYFQYFLDFILEKENAYENNLDDFLELWEEKKDKLYIVMPEGENAVQIMTIHKAKGLKFQVVILDYIDRIKGMSKSEIWVNPSLKEFPDLKTTLIPVTKSEHNIEYNGVSFNEIYEKEKEKTELDRINLMYVAFTRAVEALFIIAETPKKNKDGKLSNGEYFSKQVNLFLENQEDYDESKLLYTYGELKKLEKSEQELKTKYVILKDIKVSKEKYPVSVAPVEDIYWETAGLFSHKSKGELVHNILSEIKSANDIEKTLNKYLNEGVIVQSELNKLKEDLYKIVENEKLKQWYSENVIVLTERELIDKSGKIIRPDRIAIDNDAIMVIDYKTGEENVKHINQVNNYIKVLKEIYRKNVKGMLVYLDEDVKIKNVNPN